MSSHLHRLIASARVSEVIDLLIALVAARDWPNFERRLQYSLVGYASKGPEELDAVYYRLLALPTQPAFQQWPKRYAQALMGSGPYGERATLSVLALERGHEQITRWRLVNSRDNLADDLWTAVRVGRWELARELAARGHMLPTDYREGLTPEQARWAEWLMLRQRHIAPELAQVRMALTHITNYNLAIYLAQAF